MTLGITRDEAHARAVALAELAKRAGTSGGVARWAARLLLTAPDAVFDTDDVPLTCHRCDTPLSGQQRSWCSDACRKAASRA